MGADLIGFLVVGPETLDESKRAECETQAKKVLAEMKAAEKEWLDSDGEVDGEVLAKKYPLATRFLETHYGDCWGCEDFEAWGTEFEPYDVVTGIFDLWGGRVSPRDLNIRTFELNGEKGRVAFAGDMSWGDEPEGWGYMTVKEAEACGLLEILGIH